MTVRPLLYSLLVLLLPVPIPARRGSAEAPPNAGAFARFARVKQWEGMVHLVYEHRDPNGTRSIHATTDWTVVLKEIDPDSSPLHFNGGWIGTGSGVEHVEYSSENGSHRDSITKTAQGREEVWTAFVIQEDGYEFGGFGWVGFAGKQVGSCSKNTCQFNREGSVCVSNTDPWTIKRPLPAQGLVLAGSAVLTHDSHPEMVTLGNRYTVTWEFRPAGTRLQLEITRLEQEGGARTSDSKQMVYQDGGLRILAEARVKPESEASALRWEAPAIGNAQPTIRSRVTQGGVVSAVILYQGLPEQNSAFGNKVLKATVQDRVAEKPFQVFFERDGVDNPQNRRSGESTPNWYIYWKQGPVPELERFRYSRDASMAAGYDPVRKTLTITSEGPGLIPGLDVQLSTKDGSHTYRLTRERCEGIGAVAAIVRHELKHKELHEMRGDDYDLDAVVDAVETSSGHPWLDPFQPNTYSNFDVNLFYQDLDGWLREGSTAQQNARRQQVEDHRIQLRLKGDNELLAIVAEGSKRADETQDWAFPGSQAKKQ